MNTYTCIERVVDVCIKKSEWGHTHTRSQFSVCSIVSGELGVCMRRSFIDLATAGIRL